MAALLLFTAIGCGDGVGSQGSGGSKGDGPCEYELEAVEPTDSTPWGGAVGAELEQLIGPYPGTWTWSSSTEEIDIEHADLVLEAEATFELDESSYRINQYVGGGAGVACAGDALQADGVLNFSDADGVLFVSIPITVERTVDQQVYQVRAQLSPISVFSSGLTELGEITNTTLRGLIEWGLEGETLRATFDYTGQTNGPTGGHGFIIRVAAFE